MESFAETAPHTLETEPLHCWKNNEESRGAIGLESAIPVKNFSFTEHDAQAIAHESNTMEQKGWNVRARRAVGSCCRANFWMAVLDPKECVGLDVVRPLPFYTKERCHIKNPLPDRVI
jgi:hypothetical protein